MFDILRTTKILRPELELEVKSMDPLNQSTADFSNREILINFLLQLKTAAVIDTEAARHTIYLLYNNVHILRRYKRTYTAIGFWKEPPVPGFCYNFVT